MTSSIPKAPAWSGGAGVPDLPDAAGLPVEEVLARLRAVPTGLTSSEASRRLALVGPNALRGHTAGPAGVLGRQLMNPFLLLLAATAVISILLRDQTDDEADPEAPVQVPLPETKDVLSVSARAG